MKLFSQSIIVQVLVILLATLALWWQALATAVPMATEESGAILYDILAGWLNGTPRLAVIIALLLVVLEGFGFNILLVDAGLSGQNSLLPTLLFIIAMSAGATTLTPMILVSALLIACTHQLLLRGSLLTISIDKACMATAIIGLCTLFYLPAALLMISYMLVAVNYRLYSWKDWAVLFLGFLAPYVVLAVVLLFAGNLPTWWHTIVDTVGEWHISVSSFETIPALANIVLLLVLLAGVASVWSLSGERTVIWQKNATSILAFIVGGIAMLLASDLFPANMQLFALPFCFCVACLLEPQTHSYGRRKRKEWIFTMILILTFIAAILC